VIDALLVPDTSLFEQEQLFAASNLENDLPVYQPSHSSLADVLFADQLVHGGVDEISYLDLLCDNSAPYTDLLVHDLFGLRDQLSLDADILGELPDEGLH
jgi:hypothetical protein